jgi:hypothetical protein
MLVVAEHLFKTRGNRIFNLCLLTIFKSLSKISLKILEEEAQMDLIVKLSV